MSKGALKLIRGGTVTPIFTKSSAEMIKYDNAGSDTTVAEFLANISAGSAASADFAEEAEKDSAGNVISTTYAPIDSPNFTGTPTAPTVTDLDLDNNQVASVGYVKNQIKKLTGVVPAELDTFEELYNAMGQDSDLSTTIATQIAAKQDSDTTLTAIGELPLTADQTIYTTGNKIFAATDFKAGGREILSKATAREIRKALGICRELVLDEVEVNRWFAYGAPAISNANAKFSHALQTGGGGIYTQAPIEFGGKDFTIAFFGYLNPSSTSWSALFNASDSKGDGSRPYDITLCRYDTNNSLTFSILDANGAEVVTQHGINFNPCDGVHYYEIDYHHDAQTIEIFGDSQLIFSKNSITIPRVSRYLALGYFVDAPATTSTASFSEFTLLDGVARSSGSCTVPTAPFEVTANTVSLLHFD